MQEWVHDQNTVRLAQLCQSIPAPSAGTAHLRDSFEFADHLPFKVGPPLFKCIRDSPSLTGISTSLFGLEVSSISHDRIRFDFSRDLLLREY